MKLQCSSYPQHRYCVVFTALKQLTCHLLEHWVHSQTGSAKSQDCNKWLGDQRVCKLRKSPRTRARLITSQASSLEAGSLVLQWLKAEKHPRLGLQELPCSPTSSFTHLPIATTCHTPTDRVHFGSFPVTHRHPGKTACNKTAPAWGGEGTSTETKRPQSAAFPLPFLNKYKPHGASFPPPAFPLLPPALQQGGKTWLVFNSLLTDPGTSAPCQTLKSSFQEDRKEKKKNKPSLESKPREVPAPKAGMLWACGARGEKGGSISHSGGRKEEEKRKGKKKPQPSVSSRLAGRGSS